MTTAVAAAAVAGDLVAAAGIALWLAGSWSHSAAGDHEVAMNVACCDQRYRRVKRFEKEFYTVGVDDCDRICSLRFGGEVTL